MSLTLNIPPSKPVVLFPISIQKSPERPFILMQGNNGCGKSTLLKLLLGTIKGEGRPKIIYNNLEYLPYTDRSIIRYLPQVPEDGLFSRMSVEDNYLILQILLNLKSISFLEKLNFKLNIPVWQLSVGQQKIIILTSILNSLNHQDSKEQDLPLIILLDEPFAGLDDEMRKECFKMIREKGEYFENKENVLFVIVDHNNLEPLNPSETKILPIRENVNFSIIAASSIEQINE